MSVLDKRDLLSPTWKKIKEYLEIRLDDHRRSNDNNFDLEGTARIRGRILEVKHLLSLEEDASPD